MSHMSPEVIAALTDAARSVSLEPALLLAVVEVETRGISFEVDGSPTVLCEPATFYKAAWPRRAPPGRPRWPPR